MLILETKGRLDEEARAKHFSAQEWTQAVNAHGGFGSWYFEVASSPRAIHDILLKYASTS